MFQWLKRRKSKSPGDFSPGGNWWVTFKMTDLAYRKMHAIRGKSGHRDLAQLIAGAAAVYETLTDLRLRGGRIWIEEPSGEVREISLPWEQDTSEARREDFEVIEGDKDE